MSKHWINKLYRLQRRISDAWYYINCKLFHPHNVIKISTLPPTWVDRDEAMLHACFQILKDFIEVEEPFKIIDFDYDERHRHFASELRALYGWWINVRPNRVLPDFDFDENLEFEEMMSLMPQPPYREISNERHKLEDEWHQEDNQMLSRLIACREFLWT